MSNEKIDELMKETLRSLINIDHGITELPKLYLGEGDKSLTNEAGDPLFLNMNKSYKEMRPDGKYYFDIDKNIQYLETLRKESQRRPLSSLGTPDESSSTVEIPEPPGVSYLFYETMQNIKKTDNPENPEEELKDFFIRLERRTDIEKYNSEFKIFCDKANVLGIQISYCNGPTPTAVAPTAAQTDAQTDAEALAEALAVKSQADKDKAAKDKADADAVAVKSQEDTDKASIDKAAAEAVAVKAQADIDKAAKAQEDIDKAAKSQADIDKAAKSQEDAEDEKKIAQLRGMFDNVDDSEIRRVLDSVSGDINAAALGLSNPETSSTGSVEEADHPLSTESHPIDPSTVPTVGESGEPGDIRFEALRDVSIYYTEPSPGNLGVSKQHVSNGETISVSNLKIVSEVNLVSPGKIIGKFTGKTNRYNWYLVGEIERVQSLGWVILIKSMADKTSKKSEVQEVEKNYNFEPISETAEEIVQYIKNESLSTHTHDSANNLSNITAIKDKIEIFNEEAKQLVRSREGERIKSFKKGELELAAKAQRIINEQKIDQSKLTAISSQKQMEDEYRVKKEGEEAEKKKGLQEALVGSLTKMNANVDKYKTNAEELTKLRSKKKLFKDRSITRLEDLLTGSLSATGDLHNNAKEYYNAHYKLLFGFRGEDISTEVSEIEKEKKTVEGIEDGHMKNMKKKLLEIRLREATDILKKLEQGAYDDFAKLYKEYYDKTSKLEQLDSQIISAGWDEKEALNKLPETISSFETKIADGAAAFADAAASVVDTVITQRRRKDALEIQEDAENDKNEAYESAIFRLPGQKTELIIKRDKDISELENVWHNLTNAEELLAGQDGAAHQYKSFMKNIGKSLPVYKMTPKAIFKLGDSTVPVKLVEHDTTIKTYGTVRAGASWRKDTGEHPPSDLKYTLKTNSTLNDETQKFYIMQSGNDVDDTILGWTKMSRFYSESGPNKFGWVHSDNLETIASVPDGGKIHRTGRTQLIRKRSNKRSNKRRSNKRRTNKRRTNKRSNKRRRNKLRTNNKRSNNKRSSNKLRTNNKRSNKRSNKLRTNNKRSNKRSNKLRTNNKRSNKRSNRSNRKR